MLWRWASLLQMFPGVKSFPRLSAALLHKVNTKARWNSRTFNQSMEISRFTISPCLVSHLFLERRLAFVCLTFRLSSRRGSDHNPNAPPSKGFFTASTTSGFSEAVRNVAIIGSH